MKNIRLTVWIGIMCGWLAAGMLQAGTRPDNARPAEEDGSRLWLIGKNRNVLRMSVLSEYGQPVPVIFFGDVETLFAYFTEKFGQEEVENALN